VSRYLARYTPSRRFLSLTLFAFAGTLFSAWIGLSWWPSWIAAGMFFVSTVGLAIVTIRPVIEIHETHLKIGQRLIPWTEVRAVDQTRWSSPLAIYLTLSGEQRHLILYSGDLDASNSLRRHLQRFSRRAMLDGVPYREFWGEPVVAETKAPDAAPARYPVLRPEDEEEVERMFQRLKSAGRIDARSSDEK